MRSLCLLAFGCLVGLFSYTYNLKIKTRAMEVEARDLIVQLQDESDFLALMRAEISHLSRPERIEEAARSTLKLEPIAQQQLVPWSAIITGKGAASAQPSQKDGIAALIQKSSLQQAVIGER